jgi:elongator complex protein 1
LCIIFILFILDDLGNLIRALVPFEYVEEARAVQEKFEKFIQELESSMATIFVPLQLTVSLVSLI